MPISYRVIEALNAVITRCTGTVTDDEFISHRADLDADTRVGPGYLLLVDLRGAAEIKISVEAFRQDAAADSFVAQRQGVRVAIVAPETAIFGLARMFQLLHDEGPQEVEVFRAMPEAEQWLGVSVSGRPPAR
jgi:hypothetical protein